MRRSNLILATLASLALTGLWTYGGALSARSDPPQAARKRPGVSWTRFRNTLVK